MSKSKNNLNDKSSKNLQKFTLSEVNNQCGIWYPITRYVLAILILVTIVAVFVMMFLVTWTFAIFMAIVLGFFTQYIGSVAVLRENLLFSVLYACLTVVSVVVSGSVYCYVLSNVLTGTLDIVIVVIYAYMLYVNGRKDFGSVPQLCCCQQLTASK